MCRDAIKRVFDIIIVLLSLPFWLPLILTIVICVKWNLGNPIFFKHTRPGLNGAPFTLYKFRTMQESRDESGKLLPEEKRITKFGTFLRSTSLDELPEFINVLKGDMSFVGPRPLLMEYLNRYTSEQARRHEVKPGITGWAQVNGRNAITWEKRFELDVWYVDNQSFWIDLKILLLTFVRVITQEGINARGYPTMPEFKKKSE